MCPDRVGLTVFIVRKAHTISMLSVMHDRILTRYYKFLVVNVLVFFCVSIIPYSS